MRKLMEISMGKPKKAMAFKVSSIFSMEVTPNSELVVAPAGYSLTAYIAFDSLALYISSGLI